MLTGERAKIPAIQRLAEVVTVAAFASPFLMMGGGLTFVGLLALGPRKDLPELWVCLPAGLALLGVFAGMSYRLGWRLPRLTVTRFQFDGTKLVIETPARGCVTLPAHAVLSVSEYRVRRRWRGRRLLGWWIRLADVGPVFLDVATSNAGQLVEQLKALPRHPDAEPGAPADDRA